MLRPISLVLITCLLLSEYISFEEFKHLGLWNIVLLCVIPAIILLSAPIVLKKKYGIELLTFMILMAWSTAIFIFSWDEYVKSIAGEQVLLNNAIVLLPVVISLAILWMISSPTKQRLAWVSHRLRLDVFLLFIPLFILWGIRDVSRQFVSEEQAQDTMFIALIALVVFSPIVIRHILAAGEMPNSPLKHAIQEVGIRTGIRRPTVLVWNTHHRLMNAFAIGVMLRSKTIILTDALVTNLTQKELLAVTGHEFAHHKYLHLAFLFLGMFCALKWSANACDALQIDQSAGYIYGVQLVVMIASYILISRQFEKQADAYAAVDISKRAGSNTVTSEAVQDMSSSLAAIAFAGNIPVEKRDMLHGSIQERQKMLDDLIGCPLNQVPINKRVFWIKFGILFLLVLGFVV